MEIREKTVLITGSSKGIGEAIAYAFSKEGATVILTYNSDKEGAEKIREKCKDLGAAETLILPLDVTSNQSITQAISTIEEKFSHIDILINNAGVITWEKFEGESFEEVEHQVRTNLEGMIKMTLGSMPLLREGIINVASRAGHIPYPGRATYCATKFGVIGFTKSLALEYPDLKIFSVSPGATKTEMWDFESGTDPEKVADMVVKAWKDEIPLKDGDLNVWELI